MPKEKRNMLSSLRRIRMWFGKLILAIAFILSGIMAIGQQVQKISPKGTKFLLYTPPGYSHGGGPYPMLVVLHGQGGLGDNLNLLINKDEIPSKLIAQNRWPANYPFIVVTPQLKRDPSVPDPAEQKWPAEMVDEVIEYVRSGYAVNPNKIYITGLSQGSHGSYDYASAFPSKIAAAIFISGAPDSTLACQVKNIPIRVFHGTDDSLVPPVFAKGLIRSLNDCSPKGKFRPHLNMLHGRRHEGWNEIYNNSSGFDIYDWMLKFTKNSSANTPPSVSAGRDITIAHRTSPLHLYGEVFDSDGEIANLRWTKISGPSITMAETGSPFLKLTGLTTGTFVFELTATDDDGGQAKDRVNVTIVAKNSLAPAVTGLTLLNGNNQNVIASLYDGYVVNPKTQTRFVNIKATVTGNTRSVRFSVNGNQNSRTTNESPYVLSTPRWTLEGGDYVVCATPFTGDDGTGTAGVSQCFKLVVSTTATAPPPPAEEPPVEEPPAEEPPAEEPPAEEPPTEEPPTQEPPVEEPPTQEPPVEEPPAEEPPAEEPPVEEPPAEEPPAEEPPTEEPPAEEPPTEEPPAEEPPTEEPPAEEPPIEEPPVDNPPVHQPPPADPVTAIVETADIDVQLYPNPASETIYVGIDGLPMERLYYLVLNNVGLKIAEGVWENTPSPAAFQINVRGYASGLYVVILRTSGWQHQRKIIIDAAPR